METIEETFLSFQFPFFHLGGDAVDALAFPARFETGVIRLAEGLAAIAGLPPVYRSGSRIKGRHMEMKSAVPSSNSFSAVSKDRMPPTRIKGTSNFSRKARASFLK